MEKETDIIDDETNCINLVFFGETGVGKSTLINTLSNFFAYSSFDEAVKGEVKCVIPCSFSITDKSYNIKNVQVGGVGNNHKRANKKIGDSVTQTVKSYCFNVTVDGQLRKLRIIDTPGFGDTKGVIRDKENFFKVIDYIKKFEGLSAICILLKPNDSRLNLQFRYCFKELLVQLNKETAPNICFCYTNARATFFRPGEGYPLLIKSLAEIEEKENVKIPLSKVNVFCFDSEVFRYLAACKQGIEFNSDDLKSFKQSWQKGQEALLELVAHAANLKATSVTPIYILNRARKLLAELSKPFAEISRNIQVNKKLVQDKKKELESLNENAELLQEKLYIEQVALEAVKLDQPRTVCRNLKCVKMVKLGSQQKSVYSSCHVACSLQDIDVDVIGHANLKNCTIFDYGKLDTCKKCGHHWMEHLHIVREFKEKSAKVLDPAIKKLFDQKRDKKLIAEEAIKCANQAISGYEAEQHKLIKTGAKLASFVKKCGILFYNPDLEEYMNLLIHEEELKTKSGKGDSTVVQNLKKVRDNFYAEMDLLSTNLDTNEEAPDENDILNIILEMNHVKF